MVHIRAILAAAVAGFGVGLITALAGTNQVTFLAAGLAASVVALPATEYFGTRRRPRRRRLDSEYEAQLRRAIDRASAKLRQQDKVIYEWRTLKNPALFDPDDRGEWETEDRKGLLHQDTRFRRAFEATEDAFNVISMLRDVTSYHRDEARAKIQVALTELSAAGKLLDE